MNNNAADQSEIGNKRIIQPYDFKPGDIVERINEDWIPTNYTGLTISVGDRFIVHKLNCATPDRQTLELINNKGLMVNNENKPIKAKPSNFKLIQRPYKDQINTLNIINQILNQP
jgi:hypothetical protein